jgi:hypothetical protein
LKNTSQLTLLKHPAIFLIAYHCLKNESTRLEYQNALSEALEHQGEFRAGLRQCCIK